MEKQGIADFVKALMDEIRQYRCSFEPNDMAGCKRLLLLRSAGQDVFVQCLKELVRQPGIEQLLVIGHENDGQMIEQNWKKPYELIALNGSYSTEKLFPYKPQIIRFQADMNIYLSYSEDEQGYLNIYEMMSNLAGTAYEYQVNTYWSKIKDMKKYYQAMLLATALIDWYYGELYE